ncbi:MAG: biopolymer transporter ExbD [Pirellulales bacterium]|nr:biopolymer transporter ExbD [Pirellulales bacterium]
MKIDTHALTETAEGDMTPMIDMTFQLIAFFMVLMNFGEGEQDERIRLPLSQLAKPPDAPNVWPMTLQLTKVGTVLFNGEEVPVQGIRPLLLRESQVMKVQERDPKEATVIIRADATAKTGQVQELIGICQAPEIGFENFVLRAKQRQAD